MPARIDSRDPDAVGRTEGGMRGDSGRCLRILMGKDSDGRSPVREQGPEMALKVCAEEFETQSGDALVEFEIMQPPRPPQAAGNRRGRIAPARSQDPAGSYGVVCGASH